MTTIIMIITPTNMYVKHYWFIYNVTVLIVWFIFQAHPRYEFKYSVSDDKTEDQKTHQETRDGDNVEGEYSLLQPDGKTRTVTYRADKEHGYV